MVSKQLYKCPECKKFTLDIQWDYETLSLCQNRKQRRQYTEIDNGGPMLWYNCPVCHKRSYKCDILEATYREE